MDRLEKEALAYTDLSQAKEVGQEIMLELLNNEDIKDHISPIRPLPPEPRGGSKKHALSLSQGSFSKAAAIFLRGAYGEYVSTEKWRERR